MIGKRCHSSYMRGCPGCQQHDREEWRRRARQRAYGILEPGFLPAKPVYDHVVELMRETGASRARVAAKAGVARSTVDRLMRTEGAGLMYRDSAKALLGVLRVTPSTVSAVGTTRRLQALAASGFSVPAICQAAGIRPSYLWDMHQLRRGLRTRLSWAMAERIRRVYEQLWDDSGDSAVSRRTAQRQGWLPPEAWADGDIDNPDAEPYASAEETVDLVLVNRVKAGQRRFMELNRAEQLHMLREHLTGGGKLRTFRDRYRPAPMALLLQLQNEIQAASAGGMP